MVKKKYRSLRFIAFLLQVLAWVTLVLTLLAIIGVIVAGALNMVSIPALDELRVPNITAAGVLAGIISAVGILIAGVLNFLIFMAASEYIYVQVDIEYNTRQTAECMRQMLTVQQVAPPLPPAPMPTAAVAALPADSFAPTPTITTPTPPAAS